MPVLSCVYLRIGDGSGMECRIFFLIVIPFPKATSMNLRYAFPQFSTQEIRTMKYVSIFSHTNETSFFPFHPHNHQSILTFSFKDLSHILPQERPLLGLLRMLQLHPGAGLGGQGNHELLQHDHNLLAGLVHFWRGNCQKPC